MSEASRRPKPHRFAGEGVRPAVALVEDEVHHREHRIEPFREQVRRRDAERDPAALHPRLRARQSPLHRLGTDEKRAGESGGVEPAKGAQRQRHLRLQGQRRMAAGEDELQPLVGEDLCVGIDHLVLRGRVGKQERELALERSLAPDPVERPPPRHGHEPGGGLIWRPVARPALERRR